MRRLIRQIPFRCIISIFIITISLNVLSTVGYGEKINSIVAIVNDDIITRFDVLRRTAIAMQQESEGAFNSSDLKEKQKIFYDEAIEELINRSVLIQTAQTALLEDEIKMDEIEKDLDTFIKGAAEDVGSLSKFYEIVAEQGIDPLEKKRELRDDLMIEKILRENVYRKISVQPKETKQYYNTHLDDYYNERQVEFRHILIKFSEYRERSHARLEAEQLIERLVDGDDFASLAKQFSHGAYSKNGGLWPADAVTDVRRDLREIIYSLAAGELTNIIESPIGYHIIKCIENTQASYIPFKDVQNKIHEQIFRNKVSDEKQAYLDTIKKGFYIRRY